MSVPAVASRFNTVDIFLLLSKSDFPSTHKRRLLVLDGWLVVYAWTLRLYRGWNTMEVTSVNQ